MPAGGLVIAGTIGLAETAIGMINAGKAKKKAAQLAASRPKYQESPYIKDELSLAESELSTGMSGAASNAYEQGIDRDLSSSLNTILKGGGSVNNVAEVFGQSTQGRQRLALMKENLRLNQVNNLVRAQQDSTEQREKAFQFNQWAPWADQSQANAQARTAAQGQIMSGINTIGSAGMGYLNKVGGQKQLNDTLQTNSNSASQGGGGTGGNATIGAGIAGYNGTALPARADTSGGAPNTSSLAPGFINPNISPLDFNGMPSYSTPDISTQE
jgi:hypothetical protein